MIFPLSLLHIHRWSIADHRTSADGRVVEQVRTCRCGAERRRVVRHDAWDEDVGPVVGNWVETGGEQS